MAVSRFPLLISEFKVFCNASFSFILMSKKISPYGRHYVTHYFKRIEFQHRGSPHAHLLFWLNDAPKNPLEEDLKSAVALIDDIISIFECEASVEDSSPLPFPF